MPLAGYKPETQVIQLKGDNSFLVRGLSLDDVAGLIRTHFDDFDALFDLFQGEGDEAVENMTKDKLGALAASVASSAPGFAANVIALAAGEGDASDAEKLPFPTSVKALLAIGDLTFTEVGGVGKGLELVAGLLAKTELKDKVLKARSKVKKTG